MRLVIAPDSFKESLTAAEVTAAVAEGVRRSCPEATIDACPMADGGEGTVAAMVAATSGEIRTARVAGPLGEYLQAEFGLLGTTAGSPGRTTAVIEMAAASGLDLVPTRLRDPMLTTTYGTGELIVAALEAGATDILIGIGGSATVDGGCGCAQAVGVAFADADGNPCVCGLAGGGLPTVHRIDMSRRDPRIAGARIRVACDVTNPLTGPRGAAAVYGPQKGATPEMVRQLEAGLAHLAEVIRRELTIDVEDLPGAGAAGGLGAGLVAFLGAELQRGVEIVADAVGLRDRLAAADLCITGEGSFDAQSLSGKTAVGVARVARELCVPTICIPGQAEPGLDDGGLFAAVRPLVAGDVTVADSMRRPGELLTARAGEAMREFLAGH
ncbi:MAG: glycerate kinase [Phycisphaerae bacterium]